MRKVAKRYAQALFDLAREQGTVALILGQLGALVDLVHQNAEVNLVFCHELVNPLEGKKVIKALVPLLGWHPLLENFLLVLATNRRLKEIKEIFLCMGHLDEKSRCIIKGQVVSAYTLSVFQLEELSQVLSEKFNQKVILTALVDSSLLGGMIITVGTYCFDSSFKSKLSAFQTLARG